MAKILIYKRATPEAAQEFLGFYTPAKMPAKDVHDTKAEGLDFRVKHWPNGDQMWIFLGNLPAEFMTSEKFTGREQ